MKLNADQAWEMLSDADAILTARGKSVKTWDPKVDSKEDILSIVMGRSGNLRAPTVRVGNVFLIGFNDEMYQQYLSKS